MNKDKLYTIIGTIIFIIIVAWFYIKIADFNKVSEDDLLNEISKLELKIDSLNNQKDSIRTIIDSTHIKIITNEKHYQERINTIIHQCASSDSNFITDYIKRYREQNSLFNIE